MDEIDIRDFSKIIKLALNQKTRQFINVKNILKSEIYKLVVDDAIFNAHKHGNLTQLNEIFCLLDETSYANDFVVAVQSKLNVVVTETKPPKFRKLNKALMLDAVRESKIKIQPPVTIYVKEERSQDIMDSHLMLPGSYGGSRKR